MSISPSLATLAACAALLVPPCAGAADLAAHSRIGAIFAEPPGAVVLPPVYVGPDTNLFMAENIWTFQQDIQGYYGRPRDFYYRSYYGTAPETIFGRNPYACTILGYC
jgi:hypothetical protein